jgi:hypothetical protein
VPIFFEPHEYGVQKGECHSRPHQSKRDYIIFTYPVTDGLPNHAPCGVDGEPCVICRHSTRKRKHGPAFELVVVVCKTHKRYWTLYPPGFAPYLRRPLFALSGWVHTLFAAAWAAAHGQSAWPRIQRQGPRRGPWWNTQRRHIERAALLLGLFEGKDATLQDLKVPLFEGHQAIEAYQKAKGFRARGKAIVQVLENADREGIHQALYRALHRCGLRGQAFAADGASLRAI